MPPTSSRARLSSESALRSRLALAGERLEQPRLASSARSPARCRSRPAAAASRSSSAVRTPSARAISTERFAPEPEVAAEADELGRELALELRQLGDLARLDELAQPRLDPRADPAQLAHPPGPHQLGDRHRRAADRLGGAAVGARRVRVRVGELEQRRERLQAVGDPGVVHGTKCP